MLRRALNNALHNVTSPALSPTASHNISGIEFYKRWRGAQRLPLPAEEKLHTQWKSIVAQTSLSKKKNQYGKENFEYLEQVHIFVLAHILRR